MIRHILAPLVLAIGLGLSVPAPVLAVQPDEILADPRLEARARMISAEIRCPVCQGESIDDSNAPISRDLRLIIRERLVAGDSNDEVIDFVVDRYGEFVLFNPRATGANLVLWLAGPVLFLTVAGLVIWNLRRRGRLQPVQRLTAAEEARLAQLMAEDDHPA